MLHIRALKESATFQILSDISLWNSYVSSRINRSRWLNLSGGALSTTEQKTLHRFSETLRNGPPDVWTVLIAQDRNEIRKLKNVSAWDPTFQAVSESSRTLNKRISVIKKKDAIPVRQAILFLKRSRSRMNLAFRSAERILNVTKKPTIVTLGIILPKSKGYEAWALGTDRIILMPPKKNPNAELLATILHEYIHLLFRANAPLRRHITSRVAALSGRRTFQRLRRETGLSYEQLLEELFVSSLAPEGFLGVTLFGRNATFRPTQEPSNFEKVRIHISDAMSGHIKGTMHDRGISKKIWDQFFSIIGKELP